MPLTQLGYLGPELDCLVLTREQSVISTSICHRHPNAERELPVRPLGLERFAA